MTATPPPLLVPARSFLKRMYPLGQTKCEGILLLSHVSETKQMSILLEWSSAWRAEAASGLARDRAFIIMQWGIILGADSPSLSAKSTTVSVRWRPLLRSWLASWMQVNWQKKPRRMVRKFHYTQWRKLLDRKYNRIVTLSAKNSFLLWQYNFLMKGRMYPLV